MPIYEYECAACGQPAERFCEIAERKRQRCECGGRLEQVLRTPPQANVFKEQWVDLNGPGDRVLVTSNSQLREECRKRGKVILGETD